MPKTYIYIAISLLVSNCKRDNMYSYEIKNNSNSTIKVIYQPTFGNAPIDSFNLANNSSKNFIVIWGGSQSRVENYNRNDVYLRDLTQLDIYKNDTLKSIKNFLNSQLWNYYEVDKGIAEFRLVVDESAF